MLPGPLGASATQESQRPHGVAVGPCSQFNEPARMRADDVLPQPRGPENRYAWLIRPAVNAGDSGSGTRYGPTPPAKEAWLIRPAVNAVDRGSVTCSWPTTSGKDAGRYLR